MCAGLTVYPGGSEEDNRAEVDRIAEVLQAVTEDFAVYQAQRRFGGPVAYRAAGGSQTSRRRERHRGAVRP